MGDYGNDETADADGWGADPHAADGIWPPPAAPLIQVLVPAGLQQSLCEWLESRGLALAEIPGLEDPLPTYVIGPA